jgi:hypothetical protein
MIKKGKMMKKKNDILSHLLLAFVFLVFCFVSNEDFKEMARMQQIICQSHQITSFCRVQENDYE